MSPRPCWRRSRFRSSPRPRPSPRTAPGSPGRLTDKTVTFFCFGVIIFFAALPIVLSLIQRRLEKKKEARQYDLNRFG